MDAKSTPLSRFIDEFGNRISTDGLTKIMAEYAALGAVVKEAKRIIENCPDDDWQKALAQLEVAQHGKAKRKKKGNA